CWKLHHGIVQNSERFGNSAFQQLSIASQRCAAAGPSARARNERPIESPRTMNAALPLDLARSAAGNKPTSNPPVTKQAGKEDKMAGGAASTAGRQPRQSGQPLVRANHHAAATATRISTA